MKANIHPNWHDDATVTCSCGNSFKTGSTQESIQVDICNKCHPYFTGEMKFVDRQGRVDKFKKKVQLAQQKQKAAQAQAKKQQGDQEDQAAKSYQEILREKRAQLRKENKDK